MPSYGPRVGRDTTDDILIRLAEAEKKIARLEGPAFRRIGIDRGDIPNVAAPMEGQTMIQYADNSPYEGEKAYYYANGTWRPFGGDDHVIWPLYQRLPFNTATFAGDTNPLTMKYDTVRGGVVVESDGSVDVRMVWPILIPAPGAIRNDNAHSVGGGVALRMCIRQAPGDGTLTGFIAGAYDASDTFVSGPATNPASSDWIQFGALNLGYSGLAGPIYGDYGNMAEGGQGVDESAVATSRENFAGFSIAGDKPLFQKSTTIDALTSLDGGPGYYYLRFDFSGKFMIWGDVLLISELNTGISPIGNLGSGDRVTFS